MKVQIAKRMCCLGLYLEGPHAELDTEAKVHVEVVRQKIKEHVVGSKQRDEEEGRLGQASVEQRQRNQMWGEATWGSQLVPV